MVDATMKPMNKHGTMIRDIQPHTGHMDTQKLQGQQC